MKAIQKYNEDSKKWEIISAGYAGMSTPKAKKEIKQLRRWAKEDNCPVRYRIVDVTLTPV